MNKEVFLPVKRMEGYQKMNQTFAIVLAAGKGTRMKSDLPKVLHDVCGEPMVQHVIDQLKRISIDRIITVVGHQSEMIKQQLGSSLEYAHQEEQLGTAHAVKMCHKKLADQQGSTLIITGDTPLITEQTLRKCLEHHCSTNSAATILTMFPEDPAGYGRIVREKNGEVIRIVEHKDASEEEQLIHEVNSGIFCFDNYLLFQALEKVSTNNQQHEYYLPDVIEILKRQGGKISATNVDNAEEGLGINDRSQLARAEKIYQKRIIEYHRRNGVTIIDPSSTFIEVGVSIGKGTVIKPRTHLKGNTQIGDNRIVGPDIGLWDYKSINLTKYQNSSTTNDVSAMPYVE
ncbi:sugar phosphate nucleotidyltransferase [Aquibacillus albus]|uniref:Bifunctional UDP-N-acetylglucosamine pyrophosphorylase/glucosamine-1-phosphate N-acetyltransferase n=1 Tax=Aquibacillus albus TaxID=1168171 RepID=A0ABS2N4E0_9BACI|nr:sugar phosphate nucleotidyltransferase [Aquibacillus albus]MBM7572971.1 bifunctional UDP-N-acetylglucosamine pyrophosphorylase/glucosamine-1-phosphate N-acetyltransferase [Aquibacillus albus]